MNRAVVYKVVSAILMVCIVAQGMFSANPADAIGHEDDLGLQCSVSNPALFLTLQNAPKTRNACAAADRCTPTNTGGCTLWNTLQRHSLAPRNHSQAVHETAALETLYALHCQFTI
jgi:hypothetical protein